MRFLPAFLLLLSAQETPTIIVALPDHEREIVIQLSPEHLKKLNLDPGTVVRRFWELVSMLRSPDVENLPALALSFDEVPIRLRDVAQISVRPLTFIPEADLKDLADRLLNAKADIRESAQREVLALSGRARNVVPLLLPRLKAAKGWEELRDILFPLAYLGPHGASAIPTLVERLEGAENLEKDHFAGALAAIGASSIPELRRLLLEGIGWTRREAAQALVKIRPGGEEIVRQALTNDSPLTRKAAAEGLKYAKAVENILPLVERLADGDAEVRIAAAYSLWNHGPAARAGLTALLKMLDSTVVDEQRAAAATLGSIHAEAVAVVPKLVALLKSPDDALRSTVVTSLTRFESKGFPAVPFLPELVAKPGPRQEEVLLLIAAIGPAAAPCLDAIRTLLGSIKNDSSLIEPAMKALAGIGPAALPALDLILARADRSIEARRALASIGPAARKGLPKMTTAFFAYGSVGLPPRWGQRYMAAIDLDEAVKTLENDLQASPERPRFKVTDFRGWALNDLKAIKVRIATLEKRLGLAEEEAVLECELPNEFPMDNLSFVRAGDALERVVALLGVPPRLQKGALVYDLKESGQLRITLKNGKVFDVLR